MAGLTHLWAVGFLRLYSATVSFSVLLLACVLAHSCWVQQLLLNLEFQKALLSHDKMIMAMYEKLYKWHRNLLSSSCLWKQHLFLCPHPELDECPAATLEAGLEGGQTHRYLQKVNGVGCWEPAKTPCWLLITNWASSQKLYIPFQKCGSWLSSEELKGGSSLTNAVKCKVTNDLVLKPKFTVIWVSTQLIKLDEASKY